MDAHTLTKQTLTKFKQTNNNQKVVVTTFLDEIDVLLVKFMSHGPQLILPIILKL